MELTTPSPNAGKSENKRWHVVIVGGGFGGLRAAQALKSAPVDVTLIDRRNYHLFQPLLYQVATGSLSPGEISAPLRSVFSRQKNTRVLLGEVVDLDAVSKRVVLADGASIEYDSLIVAAGSQTFYYGHDAWGVGPRDEKHRRGDEHPAQDSLRVRSGRAVKRSRSAARMADVCHCGRRRHGGRARRSHWRDCAADAQERFPLDSSGRSPNHCRGRSAAGSRGIPGGSLREGYQFAGQARRRGQDRCHGQGCRSTRCDDRDARWHPTVECENSYLGWGRHCVPAGTHSCKTHECRNGQGRTNQGEPRSNSAPIIRTST